MAKEPRIKVTQDGPYVVDGNVPLKEITITPGNHQMEMVETRTFEVGETYSLCRCGKTKTPPFCDGSHAHNHFHGAETASHAKYKARAELQEGPDLDLYDDNRCAFARMCHRPGGSVWELVDESDDPEMKRQALEAAMDCPTGRLVAIYKNGEVAERKYEKSIALLQDPEKGVSAGLFVMGGIPIEGENGDQYEVRNRAALCRCGHSRNKPFCDAMHVPSGYEDGLEDPKP